MNMNTGAIIVFEIGLSLIVMIGFISARSEHPGAGIFVVILIFFVTGFLLITMNAHHTVATHNRPMANTQREQRS